MELWIHVDCKYMPPTVASLEKDIAGWAAEGATGVVFEWENMFPYPGLEAAVREDAYSSGDITRILDACRASGLTAVPLVQTFGHLEWLLSQQAFRSLREFDDYAQQIKACDPESTALLQGKIASLLEAHHDSAYVHLGADETYRLAQIDRPDCSSLREGACSVFLRHMKPLIDQVLSAGKAPIIWADMPLHHPQRIDDFPKDLVFCDWLYSQTAAHEPFVHDWELRRVPAERYAEIPEERRRLFERYWRTDARDFPSELYQFAYTPFLRDRGYQVVVGPATLYAGNALAATHLPNARANQRGWLRAANRFDALGALDTCWAIRGALREGTRTGHRAFLLQGRQIDALPDDAELSAACWRATAGDKAQIVAACVDDLDPPVDELSCTRPLYFDADRRTHRPVPYDQRLSELREALALIEPQDPRVEEHRAAVERGVSGAELLSSLGIESDELEAWELGCRETAIRAEAWLAAWSSARGLPDRTKADRLIERIDEQADSLERFMKGRYPDSDLRTVREDRYEGLKELLALLRQ